MLLLENIIYLFEGQKTVWYQYAKIQFDIKSGHTFIKITVEYK